MPDINNGLNAFSIYYREYLNSYVKDFIQYFIGNDPNNSRPIHIIYFAGLLLIVITIKYFYKLISLRKGV